MEWSRYLSVLYPEYDRKILYDYEKPDKTLTVNVNDIDLESVTIDLPEPPKDLREVDGFGLKAEDQKFVKPKMPLKLVKLQQKKDLTLDKVYEILEENREYYKDEIRWIKKQWYHRINGYWFFNNGKPTYIDGWHYFYISFWHIDIGIPDYRDRDRKFFLFAKYCKKDPRSFGILYPKHRREGASNKASCIHYCEISMNKSQIGGIQSLIEKDAKKVYLRFILRPWKKLPFFFRPSYQGSTEPKSGLVFDLPIISSGQGNVVSVGSGLESEITYGESGVNAYDGEKLHVYHGDELGKSKKLPILERHNVVKECLSQGQGRIIHGFYIGTSTAGEMDKGGGKNFKLLCDTSMYHKRNKNNQTPSGLYLLFLPATEGLEGFIDEYGNSIVEEPTGRKLEYLLKNLKKTNKTLPPDLQITSDEIRMGSDKYLQQQLDGLKEAGDNVGFSEKTRQFPRRYRDCWRSSAKDSGFDIVAIEDRIETLRFDIKDPTYKFDLQWVGGIFKGDVEMVINDKGPFIGSYRFPPNWLNTNIIGEGGLLSPVNNNKFSFGADPFKYNKTKQERRKSDGAGAIFLKHQAIIDGKKPIDMWKTNRFVVTYKDRPHDKNIYGEKMLMLSLFLGVSCYPELNVPFLWDYFSYHKCDNFLFYSLDERGYMRNQPGETTTTKTGQEIFGEWDSYIEHHITRELHSDILNELKDIQGPDEMTKFDLFVAGGYALLAAKDQYLSSNEYETEELDIGGHFRQYTTP